MEGNGDCIYIPIYGGVDIHKFAILFFGHRVNTLACGDFGEDLFLEYIDNSATAFFGSDSLKIEIKNIDKRAKWQGGVWNLNVPESYVNVRY
jgi:hypothetical protein